MDSTQFTHSPYGLTMGETVIYALAGIGAAFLAYLLAKWVYGWGKKFWTMRGE